jgi:hypothetical protein
MSASKKIALTALEYCMLYLILHFKICSHLELNHFMEDNLKKYNPPVTEVIELKAEGIICASGEVPGMEHGWDLDF